MLNKMTVPSGQSSSNTAIIITLAHTITKLIAKVVGAFSTTIAMNMSPRIGT